MRLKRPRRNTFTHWATDSELKFIRGLNLEGKFQYRKAMKLRRRWCRIDRIKVENELAILRA